MNGMIDAIDDADVALEDLRRAHADRLPWRTVLLIERLQAALLQARIAIRTSAMPDNKGTA